MYLLLDLVRREATKHHVNQIPSYEFTLGAELQLGNIKPTHFEKPLN